jgi:hypothetical protein
VRTRIVIGVISALLILGKSLMATVVAPSGLAPGSQYQLVFASISPRTAESADIDFYNSFVTNAAAFGVQFGLPAGLKWHAVVSTPTVHARDNAPSGNFPVYNTQGILVSNSGLYSGSLSSPITYTQDGSPTLLWNSSVWTGSDPFGVGIPGQTVGDPSGFAMIGAATSAGTLWSTLFSVPLGEGGGIYALSEPITVPVPEPGTFLMLSSALVALGGAHWLRTNRARR